MRKKWKHAICIGMACAMIAGSFPAWALTDATEAETEAVRKGQLTLEDLDTLNNGAQQVFSHNGRVTFVDGTCTPDLVKDDADAVKVVDSMRSLIGADDDVQFTLWREITDPLGNIYYTFQQMYHDTTVCGGAVKVITDADGNMIAMSSSVESKIPDVDVKESITADEAEKIVADVSFKNTGVMPQILSRYTSEVILPSVLEFSIENEDVSERFAWVVYTNNPAADMHYSSDLPYLAHYVSSSGDYLYSIPAIVPDDEAGRSGYDYSYIFEFMEPAEYTGYVDLSDGTEKEITVSVMRDKRTGMYYLGNLERRILIGQCYDFLYNGGQVVLEFSPDNLEWDQVGLLSLYNYCRAYDYYKEIGWIGPDGLKTPILVLNNYCDDHKNGVNNACYMGKIFGMQCFAASNINDLSQCLDVIAHEFTHCVTGSLMTYNSYMNDYGAINEALSDIQGKNCEMMAGDVDMDDWVMGSGSLTPVRSMSDPHEFKQPEYTWDLYYMANVANPSTSNDHGGVHFNSSLLNQIAYCLIADGGMSLEDARLFWFMTDCATVPQTDYTQLSELLPWVLKTTGMDQYEEALNKALEATRLDKKDVPETMDSDRALIRLSLPKTDAFDAGNWMMLLTTVKLEDLAWRVTEFISSLMNEDYSVLPESIQNMIEEGQQTMEEIKSAVEDKGGILSDLLGGVPEVLSALVEDASQPETEDSSDMEVQEAAREMVRELLGWFHSELSDVMFSSYGFAGQDGSTLNMVVRPGRSIPVLQHAIYQVGSDTPDQIAMAVYLNGKWYGFNLDAFMESDDSPEKEESVQEMVNEIMNDLMADLACVRGPEDLLDLITIDVEGGEVLELSSEGLDKISIPEPTPFEEKSYGTLVPGKKSRPKLEEETKADEFYETEEDILDEAVSITVSATERTKTDISWCE